MRRGVHDRRCVSWCGVNDDRGFTLVELMIGIVVALIVMAAAFTAMTGSDRATKINDQTAQAQQNVRLAMELISHDIKMAGYGMTTPLPGCNTAIVPADQNPAGADTGPDSVSLVVPVTATIAPFWTLGLAAIGPFNQITLASAAAVSAMMTAGLAAGGTVSIGGVVSQTVTGIAGASLTLGSTVSAPATFPLNTPVFLLQCVQYRVSNLAAECGGSTPCLLRNVNGTVTPISDGIEDLQLAYACDGCNAAVNGGIEDRIVDDQGAVNGTFDQTDFVSDSTWALAPLTPASIRLVRVTIVARQTQNDEGFGEGRARASVSVPVTIEDHNPVSGLFAAGDYNATTYSQVRRRTLSRTVEVRNLGL
jgi:type IV pilus assembly protein PilW